LVACEGRVEPVEVKLGSGRKKARRPSRATKVRMIPPALFLRKI